MPCATRSCRRSRAPAQRQARREILHIRNSSLYMPRDFDISPYFEIVKPTIITGFDYTALHWADKQKPLQEVAGQFGVFPETDRRRLFLKRLTKKRRFQLRK